MAERPILFSAPMVRAILAGQKTQTRRAMRDQPCELLDFNRGGLSIRVRGAVYQAFHPQFPPIRSPYGRPGDLLWVREAWRVGMKWDGTKPSDLMPRGMTVEFEAGGYGCNGIDGCGWVFHDAPVRDRPEWVGKLRPGMFMPRWASRITLRITGVRVERLQDISEADAMAEGVAEAPLPMGVMYSTAAVMRTRYREGFGRLWCDINGPGSWDANPWVWVLRFERVEPRR